MLYRGIQTRSLFTTATRLSTTGGTYQVFDRSIKLKQRERAATNEESGMVEYIRDEVARRTIERLAFLKNNFTSTMDFGCNSGNLAKQLCEVNPDDDFRWKDDKALVKSKIQKLYMVDSSESMLYKNQGGKADHEMNIERIVTDEEQYSHPKLTQPDQFDLIVSNLSLHWVNDLPSVFSKLYNSLKPNSCFVGSIFGGDTLFELRTSLQLAEQERNGGISPRVSPFVGSADVGSLMQKAGFQMLTIDVEEIVVDYPDVFALMTDLQLMGESNSNLSTPPKLSKDMLLALQPIYYALHADPKTGHLPATFRFVFMIGWKPGQNFPEPAKRGSGTVKLGDALEQS
ncbi:hypothetical protein CANARDRAFT_193434 [[Candida] arabinofermentans NRRL YB-2248]|uniref:Methyltransferase type 11 domain-containing protein n=1 Tax=[Candida] arabinofermentans NRRL YB-2248 TaxID=983967 RepID=A0A1E4T8A5_9ASCO|nr:hypothetical protein CANARDRAFT_193434 [[Candida] arabinofermentans NRRL YB-2248]